MTATIPHHTLTTTTSHVNGGDDTTMVDEGWGLGHRAQLPMAMVCLFFCYLLIFIDTSFHLQLTWPSPRRPPTRRSRNDTTAFFLCSYAQPHAKHETTPRVWFRVWHLFLVLPPTLNMKQHPHWCFFMVGIFLQVFSIPPHAEHENTPTTVWFRVRCLFWVYYIRRTRNDTLLVSSHAWTLSFLSYPLKWTSRGVYYIFYILLNSNYKYILCLQGIPPTSWLLALSDLKSLI